MGLSGDYLPEVVHKARGAKSIAGLVPLGGLVHVHGLVRCPVLANPDGALKSWQKHSTNSSARPVKHMV